MSKFASYERDRGLVQHRHPVQRRERPVVVATGPGVVDIVVKAVAGDLAVPARLDPTLGEIVRRDLELPHLLEGPDLRVGRGGVERPVVLDCTRGRPKRSPSRAGERVRK